MASCVATGRRWRRDRDCCTALMVSKLDTISNGELHESKTEKRKQEKASGSLRPSRVNNRPQCGRLVCSQSGS
jgi:hypothetical protein